MGAKIKCKKCGDVIESQSRRDLVFCSCGATYVDGGNDYLRFGGDKDNIEILANKQNKLKKLKCEICDFLLKNGEWFVDTEYGDTWVKQFKEEDLVNFVERIKENY